MIHKYQLRKPFKRPGFSISGLIAQWFFVGRIPVAPGTFGSIASYPIYIAIVSSNSSLAEIIYGFWLCFFVLTLIGWLAISAFQKETSSYDHPSVVIDEVVGMILTFALAFQPCYLITKSIYQSIPLLRPEMICFLIGLIIFRIFDITKPSLIGYVDRRVKTGFGVLLDDIMAAVFAAIFLQISYRVMIYFGF